MKLLVVLLSLLLSVSLAESEEKKQEKKKEEVQQQQQPQPQARQIQLLYSQNGIPLDTTHFQPHHFPGLVADRTLHRLEPQLLIYPGGAGQPFLLQPGPGGPNFLIPQPAPQPGPGIVLRDGNVFNQNQPQRPIFVAGFPKPAHVPKINPDAEEIPTDPSAVPPFKPQKVKNQNIENFNEPEGADGTKIQHEEVDRHNNKKPIPKLPPVKPGQRFFILNGQQLFSNQFLPQLSKEPYQPAPLGRVAYPLPGGSFVNHDQAVFLPFNGQPSYLNNKNQKEENGQPILQNGQVPLPNSPNFIQNGQIPITNNQIPFQNGQNPFQNNQIPLQQNPFINPPPFLQHTPPELFQYQPVPAVTNDNQKQQNNKDINNEANIQSLLLRNRITGQIDNINKNNFESFNEGNQPTIFQTAQEQNNNLYGLNNRILPIPLNFLNAQPPTFNPIGQDNLFQSRFNEDGVQLEPVLIHQQNQNDFISPEQNYFHYDSNANLNGNSNNKEEEDDSVVIDAKVQDDGKDDKEAEEIIAPPKQEEESSIAQAAPGAIALAGPGGIASSGPRGTALVGVGGLAVSNPKATAVAGPKEEEKNKKNKKSTR